MQRNHDHASDATHDHAADATHAHAKGATHARAGDADSPTRPARPRVSRRSAIWLSFGALSAPALLAACGGEATSTAARSTSGSAAAGTSTGSAGAGSKYLGSYTLDDEKYGTQVTTTVKGSTRTIKTNALPDTRTGTFPNAGNPNTIAAQDNTYTFTTEPTFLGEATPARTTGVAINGVKFEPGTAETVTCASGETYRVEAVQQSYDLGLDFNNAHVQPDGEYHYHGVSELMVDVFDSGEDLVHVGFAADGFLMYYSKSGAYRPSYVLSTEPRTGTGCVASSALGGQAVDDLEGTTPDGTYTSDYVFDESAGDLDECNGTTIDGAYAYLITDAYPFVGRCLNGEVSEEAGGPPPGNAPEGAPVDAPEGAPG